MGRWRWPQGAAGHQMKASSSPHIMVPAKANTHFPTGLTLPRAPRPTAGHPELPCSVQHLSECSGLGPLPQGPHCLQPPPSSPTSLEASPLPRPSPLFRACLKTPRPKSSSPALLLPPSLPHPTPLHEQGHSHLLNPFSPDMGHGISVALSG